MFIERKYFNIFFWKKTYPRSCCNSPITLIRIFQKIPGIYHSATEIPQIPVLLHRQWCYFVNVGIKIRNVDFSTIVKSRQFLRYYTSSANILKPFFLSRESEIGTMSIHKYREINYFVLYNHLNFIFNSMYWIFTFGRMKHLEISFIKLPRGCWLE